jgi:NAD(P)-dependent dehydrogenase (short-subunit alcohol dehydrogenase family)
MVLFALHPTFGFAILVEILKMTFTATKHHDTYDRLSPSRPDVSAKGKHVVITGGGAGIGKSITYSFAQAGAASILITGRTELRLAETKAALEKEFPQTLFKYKTADISNPADTEAAFAGVDGGIDILVANAAYLPEGRLIKETDADDWFKGLDINVKGSVGVAKSFLKYANEGAVLIHLATAMTHMPPVARFSGYGVSKLAQQRLFEFLQFENPQYQIIGVHPGVVESEMNTKASDWTPVDSATLPADFIVWAASSEAEFLKGRTVWANWDIDELKAKKDEILSDPTMLTHVFKGI